MNKISCDVCKDLITLYVDNLCSNQSKELVEEHLRGCVDCTDTYEAMKGKIVIPALDESEKNKTEEFNMTLKKTWRRFATRKTLTFSGIFIAALAIVVSAVYFLFFHYYYVPAEDVEIINLCQLVDGRIACQIVDKDEKKGFNNFKFIPYTEFENGEKGALYLVAERTLFDRPDYSVPCYADCSAYILDDDIEFNYSKLYYGTPDDKDKICYWIDGYHLYDAEGDMAKYYYQNNKYFYNYNEAGDIWVSENPDITLTYHTKIVGMDGMIDYEVMSANIEGFGIYEGESDLDKNVLVHDDIGSSTLLFINESEDEYDIVLEGKYSMKDENTLILTLNNYFSFATYEGKPGDKLVFHKSESKGELNGIAKRQIITEFSSYPSYYPIENIKEFYYDYDEKKGISFAAKVLISDLDYVEQELDIMDMINSEPEYDCADFNWWNVNKDNVIKAYETTYEILPSDSLKLQKSYSYITEENGEYYFYTCYESEITE